MAKLTIYIPDELRDRLRAVDGLNVSAICQASLDAALTRREAQMDAIAEGTKTIEVSVGGLDDDLVEVTFDGRWLVPPDRDVTRAAIDGPGADNGVFWGVAVTAQGRIAVYAAHVNDGWSPQLNVFDDLEDAELPTDIYKMAATALAPLAVHWDI